jgi:hypothetical protein
MKLIWEGFKTTPFLTAWNWVRHPRIMWKLHNLNEAEKQVLRKFLES